MLFNSFLFIVVFLPTTYLGYLALGRANARLAALWLTLVSLLFYGYWNPRFLALLLSSIATNYLVGVAIARTRDNRPALARLLLTGALIFDLGVLGAFKYLDFLLGTVNLVLAHAGVASGVPLAGILLPLGISFFTFTQIAFLVDVYRGLAREHDAIHYLLFVTWFPHLIAGPVLHHAQIMPQFAARETWHFSANNLAMGLAIFSVGLAKKVLLADSFAALANPVFAAADGGIVPQASTAWLGALAYTLQLYFDFSGYSDMAIGASRLFGVQLPLNFNSPYKAHNIIEFWRRWHMTLSQFLREYLYFPLGGNRQGEVRRHVNLMITMLLGGLWHGANWTFVAWGGLHGSYLVLNHLWHARTRVRPSLLSARVPRVVSRVASGGLTFVAVVVAWVLFRATTFAGAGHMLNGMFDLVSRASLRSESAAQDASWPTATALQLGALGCALVWFAPNTQRLAEQLQRQMNTDTRRMLLAGVLCVAVFMLAAINNARGVSAFIYFNF